MIEIHLINGIQEVSNCTAKFIPNKLIISSTLDPEHVIFEYDLKDVSGESCCAMFESVEKLENTLSLIEGKFAIHPYRTGCIRMDVYPLGYDKGGACKYVYEKLGYKKEDNISFYLAI